MENNKPATSMFLKFLPRASSAVVTFQNHPFSPGRDHNPPPHHHHHHHHHNKHKGHAHKGFSGPINFSALPDEARTRPNNHDEKPQEPTSPKVSCMGQIKHKKKKLLKAASRSTTPKKSSSSAISKLLFRRSHNGAADNAAPHLLHKNNNNNNNNADNIDATPAIPKLGSMRKFASGRESLADFDWTTTARIDHHREYYSDEERGGRRDNNDEVEDDDVEDVIPFSAPMVVGGRGGGGGVGGGLGLEPRKEVNLWKRRTLPPPPPLTLKVRS